MKLQGDVPANGESMRCSPLVEIRDTQGQNTIGSLQGSNSKGIHTLWPEDSNAPALATHDSYPSLYASEGSGSSAQMHTTTTSTGDGFETALGFGVQSAGTDTSPDNSNQDGTGSRPPSNHPTPSTASYQTSSRTSYTSPPNQSGNGHAANGGQDQASPGYLYSNGAFNMNMSSHVGQSPQQHNLNFGSTGMTPGRTGMTPIPDPLWPAEGITDGNEWMFTWPGSTPQPQ